MVDVVVLVVVYGFSGSYVNVVVVVEGVVVVAASVVVVGTVVVVGVVGGNGGTLQLRTLLENTKLRSQGFASDKGPGRVHSMPKVSVIEVFPFTTAVRVRFPVSMDV